MTDRERFEAAISASPYEKSVARWPNLPVEFAWPGGYKDLNVDLAWWMWQASRKQALEEARAECLALIEDGSGMSMDDVFRNMGVRSCVTEIMCLANPEGEQG